MTAFLRVVELGSFSAAAREMRVGQPAISRLIATLEEELGVRLLVRTTRAMHLTEAGEAFQSHARRAVEAADDAWAVARNSSTRLEGKLRVSAPVTFARLHLVPHLGSFLAAHPRLVLDLQLDDRPVHLVEHGIDVALRLQPPADKFVRVRQLATSDRMVVASPEYLARRGVPLSPRDLVLHDAVVYSQAAGGEEWRFSRNGEAQTVRVESQLYVSAAEGVRAAVLAGLGVCITSRWMMDPELERGDVVPVLTDWTLPPMGLWLLIPAGEQPSAKTRAFARWCRARFRNATPATQDQPT